jgi:hypothetical protein
MNASVTVVLRRGVWERGDFCKYTISKAREKSYSSSFRSARNENSIKALAYSEAFVL